MKQIVVKNIDWNIDPDEAVEILLDNISVADAAKVVGMDPMAFLKMPIDELKDVIKDSYRHKPGAFYDLLDLPEMMEIPSDTFTEDPTADEVKEWLEEEYGYFINHLYVE